MKKDNVLTILVIMIYIILMFIAGINADESGGVLIGKQNSIIILPQECSSCTYVKLTTITYPNLQQLSIQTNMIQDGTSYSYNFNQTNQIGKYTYCMVGDVDGIDTSVCKDFQITPTGYNNNLLGFYIIALVLIWGIFILGLWKRDMTFAVLGTIGFYIVALYLLIMGINGTKDWLSNGIGVIHLGVAFYTSIRYTLESIDLNW